MWHEYLYIFNSFILKQNCQLDNVIEFGLRIHATWQGAQLLALLTAVGLVPSLKLFLALLATFLKCDILPVPWPLLLIALVAQLSIYIAEVLEWACFLFYKGILTSSGLGTTTGSGATLLLLVEALASISSTQSVRLSSSSALGRGTSSL